MTDQSTNPDVWPDSADPVDEALTQLQDPRALLAEALILTRAAGSVGMDIETHQDLTMEALDREHMRHRRLLDEAFQLAQLAKIASQVAAAERVVHPLTSDDLDATAEQPSPVDGPQAVNGVKFTARISGRFMGRVGGREWLWTEGAGFLDVTHADTVDPPDVDGYTVACFGGVVRSTDGEQALCITDYGNGVVLPRALLHESPDE